MSDIKSPEARSRNMARIKSKDTKPEIWLRKALYRKGYRYRKNANDIFGHPDIWLPKYNTAVFVHGCFWHRHINCKYAYMPQSRVEFWEKKFHANRERDQKVISVLTGENKKVLIVWECVIRQMIKNEVVASDQLNRIECFFRSREEMMEIGEFFVTY